MKIAGTAIFGRSLVKLRVINLYGNNNSQALALSVGDFWKKSSMSFWKEIGVVDVKANGIFSDMLF
jgi:hypothetical protein